MESLRELAKNLFRLVPLEQIPDTPFCCHPFSSSIYTVIDGELIDIMEDTARWKTFVFNQIDKTTMPNSLLTLINKPWRLFFVKLCFETEVNISMASELLGVAWTTSENPNDDLNVSLDESISYFKKADKKALMEKEELEVLESLPAEVTLYRGVSIGRNPNGLSYTRDFDKAVWFRDRWLSENTNNSEVYIIKAIVQKNDCLAYFNSRGEEEIVVNSYNIKHKEII